MSSSKLPIRANSPPDTRLNQRTALDRHVGTAEKNELLRRLAPLKRDIVANY